METRKIKQVFGAVVILSTVFFVSSAAADAIVVEDVNLDSIPDIVTKEKGINQFAVFLGKGDGTFEKSFEYAAPFFSLSLDRKGNLVALDQKGEQIHPTGGGFSANAKGTRGTKTIATTTGSGSCFYLLEFAGDIYKVPLPPSVCQE